MLPAWRWPCLFKVSFFSSLESWILTSNPRVVNNLQDIFAGFQLSSEMFSNGTHIIMTLKPEKCHLEGWVTVAGVCPGVQWLPIRPLGEVVFFHSCNPRMTRWIFLIAIYLEVASLKKRKMSILCKLPLWSCFTSLRAAIISILKYTSHVGFPCASPFCDLISGMTTFY